MNTRLLLLFTCVALLSNCKSATEPGPVYHYMPLTIGSHWHYFDGTNNYTRTVVNDTTMNGKVYAVVVQTPKYQFPQRNPDSVWYYRADGNNVYVLLPDTTNTLKECMFINSSQGAAGSYNTLTFIGTTERFVTHVNYSVTMQNFQDTVSGKIYSNVLRERIQSDIFHPGSITISTQGDYYYADGVGLIDQIVSGDLTMVLIDYEIK